MKTITIALFVLIAQTCVANAALQCTASTVGQSCGQQAGCARGFYLCGYNETGRTACQCEKCADGYYDPDLDPWPNDSGGIEYRGVTCTPCQTDGVVPEKEHTEVNNNNGVLITTDTEYNLCTGASRSTTTYACVMGYYDGIANSIRSKLASIRGVSETSIPSNFGNVNLTSEQDEAFTIWVHDTYPEFEFEMDLLGYGTILSLANAIDATYHNRCVQCPSDALSGESSVGSDGRGAVFIDECYLPAGRYSDESGDFIYTNACYYNP